MRPPRVIPRQRRLKGRWRRAWVELEPWLRPPLRMARQAKRAVLVEAPAALSVLPSLRRDPWQVARAWPDIPIDLPPDVALFVHFDPAGAVAPRVLGYLAALRAAGFGVLFVSNSGALGAESWAALRPLCAGVLVRRNIGYDFCAMRAGLAHWGLPRTATRRVLIANDSVLGPFAPLGPLLARARTDPGDPEAADLWGATDSEQRGWHLQSWFVLAGRRALDHPGWAAFWAGVRPVRSKAWVIGRYELGLTRHMLRAGLRCRALFPTAALLARFADDPHGPAPSVARLLQSALIRRALAGGDPLNPTAYLWRQLLEAGCPFVKRELAGANPARVIDAAEWREEVMARFGPDPAALSIRRPATS